MTLTLSREKGIVVDSHSNCVGGAINRCATGKESENAGENGISNGEREIWSLYNVNVVLGF